MASYRKVTTVIYPTSTDAVAQVLEETLRKAKGYLFSVFSLPRRQRLSGENSLPSFRLPSFNKKNAFKIIVPVIIVFILVIGVFALFGKHEESGVAGVATTTNKNDVKTLKIGREFEFPLKDAKGVKTGTFKYIIDSAELRHRIVVKGQNATSVQGRVFLVLNLKLVNSLSQGLQINSRDYVRISVNNNKNDWFAADIHNDPVEAQAISTTPTRIGIAINETDRDIKLQVGEINGKKEVIPVNL